MSGRVEQRADAIAAGAEWYFTGKSCVRGHIAERYISGTCVLCNREKAAAHTATRPREQVVCSVCAKVVQIKQGQKPNQKKYCSLTCAQVEKRLWARQYRIVHRDRLNALQRDKNRHSTTCPICYVIFETTRKKYCSKSCASEAIRQCPRSPPSEDSRVRANTRLRAVYHATKDTRLKPPPKVKPCKVCSVEFIATGSYKFCSAKCQSIGRRQYDREYRDEHDKEWRARKMAEHAAWLLLNPPNPPSQRRRYAEDPEKSREAKKRYEIQNLDRINARTRELRIERKAALLALQAVTMEMHQ